MGLEEKGANGLALGAWGAVQASAAGIAMTVGGLVRDSVGGLAEQGAFGAVLAQPWTGYSAVYHLELALLLVTLAAIGPLARHARRKPQPAGMGLADMPR
jgi:MFS transporter, BCD family, chlorophyll transporter